MRFVQEYHRTDFGSGTTTTPQFDSFVRKARNEFRKKFGDVAENIQVYSGHFYFSGFLTRKSDGQVFYFSISDVRHFPSSSLLIRTARDYKDYTGGRNEYIGIDDNFERNLKEFLTSQHA